MIHDFTLSPRLNSPNILWQNILPEGTVTATSENAGLAVSALSQSTNDAWGATAGATLTSAGSNRAANMAGFAAHTLTGRTVFVEYLVGASWVTAASLAVTSNAPFMLSFGHSDGITAASWRVRVTGGAFAIGVAYLGVALRIPGVIQIPHTPLHLCETVELMGGNQSRSGQFLLTEYELFAGQASLSFQVQMPEFVLGEFEAFRQWFNRGNAFFIACAAKRWPLDMGYCRRNGAEIVPPWRDAVHMGLDMQVEVYRG
jgi:hypothetical protein